MSAQDSVLLIDSTAQIRKWGKPGTRQGFWVMGNGWETKITYSENRAWELAEVVVKAQASKGKVA